MSLVWSYIRMEACKRLRSKGFMRPADIKRKRPYLTIQPLLNFFYVYLESLLLDTCFLAGEITEVENTCPSYAPVLINLYFINKWRSRREDPFHTNVTRHFTNGKSLSITLSAALDNDTPVLLYTLLISFDNLVVNSDGITGAEFGQLLFSGIFLAYNLH